VEDVFSYFEKPKNPITLSAMKISIASPEKNSFLVTRRGKEAGNNKLPDIQTGKRRSFLRQDIRTG